MEHIEVLGTSRDEPRSRRSRLITVTLAAAAVVLAGGVWWFDQSQRDGESTELAQCVTRADQAGRYAEARVSMMRTYITPVLGTDASESTRSGLFALVRQQATATLPPLERARETCRAVAVEPWHADLGTARSDYLTYLDARTAVLRTIAVDGGRSLTGDEGVPQLREKALASLGRAGITP